MSEYTPSTSVTASGLALFTDENAQTNIQAITKVYLDQIQILESAIAAIRTSRLLDSATNAQLDLLGALVGRPRGNFMDTDYRPLIRAQILVNRSDGSAGAMTDILAAMIKGSSVSASYVDTSDLKFQVTFVGLLTSFSIAILEAWNDMIGQAKALGSGRDVIFTSAAKASTLVWCAVADELTTTSKWDDVADTLTAGDWAGVA